MLCERCGKNKATVHAVKTLNGVTREEHICADCASKAGIFDTGVLLGSLFSTGRGVKKVCSNCGCTYEDFSRTGLVGCSECYKEFSNELMPVLRRMHGNAKHVGNAPAEVSEQLEKEHKIDELRERLKEAIEKEDFENAAVLRDEINALKGGNANG